MTTTTKAKVILDSVSPRGERLTTMEVTFHRFILSEFNTHRVFSRNSASSRAIPVRKQIEMVQNDPAIPVSFPAEQPGMQGGEELNHEFNVETWLIARDYAVRQAQHLASNGVHKSVVNRILEPFMWHTAIISATDWNGFWEQRCSPLAQPEIRVAAEAMKKAYDASTPSIRSNDSWHTPYILPEEYDEFSLKARLAVSAARCARVSYLTHQGVRDVGKDLELYSRLTTAEPPHWSPLEHVATPATWGDAQGNFVGWHQLRHVGMPS